MEKNFIVIQTKYGKEYKVYFEYEYQAEDFKEECLKKFPNIDVRIEKNK